MAKRDIARLIQRLADLRAEDAKPTTSAGAHIANGFEAMVLVESIRRAGIVQWTRDLKSRCGRFRIDPTYSGRTTSSGYNLIDLNGRRPDGERQARFINSYSTIREAKAEAAHIVLTQRLQQIEERGS